MRLLLADDHPMFRQSLKAFLEREGFEIVAEASDGHEAVELTVRTRPDVAVLDLSMPRLNGLQAAREILKVAPRTRPILVTMRDEEAIVLQGIQAGVRAYVLKAQAAEDLVQALREVSKGAVYLSPGISHALVDAVLTRRTMPSDPLSQREAEVLQLVSEGNTNKEIASLLNISVKTAESHRGRIMDKLNIHDTASLVRYAIRRGIIQA